MADRPSGTITFLFTDIEGSTRMWERDEEAMKAALARHDAILHDSIEGCGGYIFKTVGDAFCAAFANAPEALNAALTAQRALQSEAWDARLGAISVRMALHTGTAEERDGDYFGPPLNRVARLLAAGHGGQTLLSLAVQELVRDHLPQAASLIDLGQHRLKDLFRPEHVFQLNTPDLPAEFPPLHTLDARRTNLPAQPTPLIGRDREVTAVLNLMRHPDVRLVTLTGPGGTGKTRLSLQVAADLIDEYEHGVYFVALAPTREPQLVAQAVASTLGVKESADKSLVDALKDHLADQQMLLVLDNFEQIIAAAPLVGELLSAAPQVKMIITSRERLRVYGEHDYPVPPLGLPEKGRRQTVAVLSQYEAVALFIQRAKAAKPDFEITDENAPAVAEICMKLDGLPLAIELAAARSNLLHPAAMLERLTSRLLTGGARDLPARQQTIRGAIDWSYDLLNEPERALFSRLAVFSGGWTLEAAEAVSAEKMEVLDRLESLLDKSLIRPMDSLTDAPRFVMLEVIREYAAEKLNADGEGEAVREAHAAYFADLAEAEAPKLRADAMREGMLRLTSENDNLRAAIVWSLESPTPIYGIRIASSLWFYWHLGGSYQQGFDLLKRAVERLDAAPSLLKGDTLRAAGNLAVYLNNIAGAEPIFQQALEVYKALGDRKRIAYMLNNLGVLAQESRQFAKARSMFEEARVVQLAEGDEHGALSPLANLGHVAWYEQDFGQAIAYYKEVRQIAQRLGAEELIGSSSAMLGHFHTLIGDFAAAEDYLAFALTRAQERRLGVPLANLLAFYAALNEKLGHDECAATLLGASSGHFEALGVTQFYAMIREIRERIPAVLQERLSAEAFKAAWDSGWSMTTDEAVAYALGTQA